MFEGMASVVLGEHLAGELFAPRSAPAIRGLTTAVVRTARATVTCARWSGDKQWRKFLEVIGDRG